jgi:NAD(P)-dependent dehydrogenase (short-subunit alcohol dehydrogenase family)
VFSLKAKKALITGGTRGIGLAVAARYLEAGAEVMVCGRGHRPGIDRIDVHFAVCDQAEERQVMKVLQTAMARYGNLDVLVINAGVSGAENSLGSIDCSKVEEMWRTNSLGVLHFLKHGPKYMNDGGSIIVTTSAAADYVFPDYAAYGVSKSGIGSLVRHAAMELGRRGIRVNSVSPGTILTDIQQDDDPEAIICQVATCLGRLGSTDDVVGAYHYLAAQESSYVTGTNLVVDGGWLGGLTNAAAEKLTAP